MPYAATLERKIALIPIQYQQELMDFVDFLLARSQTPQNGLDVAIAELENGEYDTYSSFDDFMPQNDRAERVESLFGSLHRYANPALREKEDTAWEMAVEEKYGLR